jgi:hypothetical protein
MGLIDFLKKIGVIKNWNAKGTYTNAKERPKKFVEKDLYDGTESQSFSSFNDNND